MNFIATPHAPAAIGPYSQAVVHQGLVFCSGQIALDPKTGTLIGHDPVDLELQVQTVLSNLDAVLVAAGSRRDRVIKTTVFLRDMKDFPILNKIYAEYFGDHRPARATVAAAGLPRDVLVEIECIAAVVSEGAE